MASKKSTAVVVCMKMPQDQIFRLSGGRTVTLAGKPLSALYDAEGKRMPGAGYGRTYLSAEEWEELLKTYGKMDMFRLGLIFAEADEASANARAAEQDEVKNGLEQVDPNTDPKTVTAKADEKKGK